MEKEDNHLSEGKLALPVTSQRTPCHMTQAHITQCKPSVPLPSDDAFVHPQFPLTKGVMVNLCTRCWHPTQTRPLCQETGEEAMYGFYYKQQLNKECELLLNRSISIMDIWEIQSAKATFIANPAVFHCQSILIVLDSYEAYMRNLLGWNNCFDAEPNSDETSVMSLAQADDYVSRHSFPKNTSNTTD